MKKEVLLFILTFLVISGCKSIGENNEVYVIAISPGDMRQQFLAGNIDGFIAWEPFNADLVVSGKAKYLIQSSDIWKDHPCCVLSAKTDDEDVIKAAVWAHIKATEFINNPANKDKVINYAVEFTGKDKNVIEEALKHIEFIEYPDKDEFMFYYKRLYDTGLLIRDTKSLGFNDKDDFFNHFLIREYYEEVKENLAKNPEWKPEYVDKEVKIGYLTADLHQLAYYVALKEGYYDKVFQNLKASEFKSGLLIMDAYKANLIDLAYVGAAPAILKRINEDIPITVTCGANNLGSAIVVRNDINSLKDLKGKIIAVPTFGGVQDVVLRMAAESANLKVAVKK